MSVGNSRLSLVAALRDLSGAGGVSSKFKTLFMPNLSLNVFDAKNSSERLLVRDCQCLPSKK